MEHHSGDGAPPVANLNDTFKGQSFAPPSIGPERIDYSAQKEDTNKGGGDMPILDVVHVLFLWYSGAHNIHNAWGYAHNTFFFLFVVVGIISVELVLWAVYKYYKEGKLVGRMNLFAIVGAALAMFFATAGILADAQTGTENSWLVMYYQWVLPCSAPVMFIVSFLVQSSDPIKSSQRDIKAYEKLLASEEIKVDLDEKRLKLNEKRNSRILKSKLMNMKHEALYKETMSRRSRSKLKVHVREEAPKLLTQAGITSADNTSTDNTSADNPAKK